MEIMVCSYVFIVAYDSALYMIVSSYNCCTWSCMVIIVTCDRVRL
jgi:hypothetical protein